MAYLTKEELAVLSKLGKKGGRTTVEKYGRLKMQEWGKLGGRPKKAQTSQEKPLD